MGASIVVFFFENTKNTKIFPRFVEWDSIQIFDSLQSFTTMTHVIFILRNGYQKEKDPHHDSHGCL